jgi:hypothetical protein
MPTAGTSPLWLGGDSGKMKDINNEGVEIMNIK